jgi:dTDP-4-amino-4,6-dideoxygalactose transaminase
MMKYLDLKAINQPYEHVADEVLQSGWYLKGDYTRRFEAAYAQYIGTHHCVACGNGLDALTLIFRAYIEMGLMQPGDEVIVPANTYIASILAVTENRLKPVLVEPSLDTLQIDDTLIEQAITPRTRAVMIVHLYGRCAYTDRIGYTCQKYGLKLIEDNAQAHGCKAHQHPQGGGGTSTGALGDAAGHSFYPTKNLGAFGDAGAVTTNDEELATMVRALGNYGSARHYVFDHLGRNSRMDEVQAAILLAKLRDLDASNLRRKEIAAIYTNKVKNPNIVIPQCDRDSVYHIFPVLCPRRDELQRYLADNAVGTEIHYPIPPHKQKCLAGILAVDGAEVGRTEQIHAQELSIPCHQALTDDEVMRVVSLLNGFS